MKTTKMSLANMEGKLSRNEMKNIKAGQLASGISGCGDDCSGSSCIQNKSKLAGTCHANSAGACFCVAVY